MVDLYSLESELMQTSRKKLADDAKILTPLEKLRLLCLSQGAAGFVILGRHFSKLNEKDELSFDTFKDTMKCSGFVELSDNELLELYENFKNSNEFFGQLRPSMSETRLNILDKAFSKMDTGMLGYIDFEAFKKVYAVDRHPKYQNGDCSKANLFEKVLKNFENNSISKADFLNYYSAISAQIDEDIYFDLLIRECFHL